MNLPPRPSRYDHCRPDCTTDCGHCKGIGDLTTQTISSALATIGATQLSELEADARTVENSVTYHDSWQRLVNTIAKARRIAAASPTGSTLPAEQARETLTDGPTPERATQADSATAVESTNTNAEEGAQGIGSLATRKTDLGTAVERAARSLRRALRNVPGSKWSHLDEEAREYYRRMARVVVPEYEERIADLVDLVDQVRADREGMRQKLAQTEAMFRQELDEARASEVRVCQTVAAMHAAAVGEVRGPIRGVVEDVADVRAELARVQANADRWRAMVVEAAPRLDGVHRLLHGKSDHAVVSVELLRRTLNVAGTPLDVAMAQHEIDRLALGLVETDPLMAGADESPVTVALDELHRLRRHVTAMTETLTAIPEAQRNAAANIAHARAQRDKLAAELVDLRWLVGDPDAGGSDWHGMTRAEVIERAEDYRTDLAQAQRLGQERLAAFDQAEQETKAVTAQRDRIIKARDDWAAKIIAKYGIAPGADALSHSRIAMFLHNKVAELAEVRRQRDKAEAIVTERGNALDQADREAKAHHIELARWKDRLSRSNATLRDRIAALSERIATLTSEHPSDAEYNAAMAALISTGAVSAAYASFARLAIDAAWKVNRAPRTEDEPTPTTAQERCPTCDTVVNEPLAAGGVVEDIRVAVIRAGSPFPTEFTSLSTAELGHQVAANAALRVSERPRCTCSSCTRTDDGDPTRI